jgi:hypothetical protein
MIKTDLLKNNPHAIPAIASIWYEVLGKIWMPEIGIKEIESLYYQELNQNMPITYIAVCIVHHDFYNHLEFIDLNVSISP